MVVTTAIVVMSFDRRTYFSYRHQYPALWEHPTTDVVLVALATLVETAVACFVFGSEYLGRTWRRGLVGLLILVPWGCLLSMVIIHSPGFWMLHILWVWLLVACMALAALLSGVLHTYSLFRDGQG